MNVILTSDWHLSPFSIRNDILEHLLYLEEKANQGYKVLVLGDWVDTLEFGKEAYGNMIDSLLNFHPNFVWFKGNHNPDVGISSLIIDDVYFSHGHQWCMLWGWLPIYRFPIPKCLWKLYRTPAKEKEQNLTSYHILTIQIESTAAIWGVRNKFRGVAFGHTHSPHVNYREGITTINSGDWIDSFSWIEGNTETNTWELKRLKESKCKKR